MAVAWLADIDVTDVDTVGGKAASLGELTDADRPVPSGFVVTADTYRRFIESADIATELFETVDVDHEDSQALKHAHERAHELIMDTDMPERVREEIYRAYTELGSVEEPFVAVRSSATAEDLPDASFAGQQETFLNVQSEMLIDRVKECWASLFSQRAIYYRNRQGFAHADVDIAVVVQEMVDADKSGVMFTSHPSTGADEVIIEAAWGLGEAVVSGSVSPDNYTMDKQSASVESVEIADKKTMMIKQAASGETVETEVPSSDREARVLSDTELEQLVKLGRQVESHYQSPQDVEWAIKNGSIYMLQSRPITTIDSEKMDTHDESSEETDGVIVDGLGASPGVASGEAQIITELNQIDQVSNGDIIVTEMTMPDMVPAMKRASGIVTDEGGMTSHASIISRELGVPAVVGTETATQRLTSGKAVTIDGEKGTVRPGAQPTDEQREPIEEARPTTPVKPMTATRVKVNVSIPEAAERAAATGADGVGLLRTEHMVLSLGKTPSKFIADHGERAYIDELVEGIQAAAEEFYPRPVRVRTLDAPTDEFRQLEGGEDEPREHNPMLGYRGIRRSLDNPKLFNHELQAFRRVYQMGYDNVELMLPLVNDAEDVRQARHHMEEAGIDTDRRSWGIMIETPAAALEIESIADTGVDFVSFGTNDLTQYTLAVDRNNEHVADRFDELHPSILSLIETTIETCRELDIDTSICGQAGSRTEMVNFLIEAGISSISANIDAVRDVQHEVKRVEQRLILDTVR